MIQADDAVPGQDALHAQLFGRPQRGAGVGATGAAEIGQDPQSPRRPRVGGGQMAGLTIGRIDGALLSGIAQRFEGAGGTG